MFEKLKHRYIACLALIFALFVLISVQMYRLVAKGEQTTTTTNTASVSIAGKRGTVYDKNGVALAYDQESYEVTFYRDPVNNASSDRANYTQILLRAIDIIESNGDSVIDTFLIVKNEAGEFTYDLSAGLSEEARQERIEAWCANMQIADHTMEPEDIYYDLRSRFRIPEELDYTKARQLLSIWQEVQMNMYRSYVKVTIAENVSLETVYQLETRANELTGIEIAESYTRYYPKESTAAHILGYLGRIVDAEELEEKRSLGYTAEDLVGKVGIEATMETYLSGCLTERQGKRTYALSKSGSIIGQQSYTAPSQGDSVVLTIDIGLQEVTEEALAANVQKIRKEQEQDYAENQDYYDKLLEQRSVKELSLANAGAAIVMEIDTGNVLAMASYPSYDLNLFTGGISDEDYQSLLDQEGSPLFNNAISSTSTPGSIFKMATAVAGLMEGEISVNTTIEDKGPYDKYVQDGSDAPACWVKPNYSSHGRQTVVEALKNSCNYFFFEVADRLGIDRLSNWVSKLGLTSKTNIQLTGEAVGWIGGPEILYDSTSPIDRQKTYKPILVYNKLMEQLEEFGEKRNVEYSEEQLSEAALALIKLVELQNLTIGPEIRQVLSDKLDIPENVARQRGWTSEIMSTLIELIWTPTDTATQGIGVTPTQLTPIAIARYLCAISNGGKVYEANIIDKVVSNDGSIVLQNEPRLIEDLQLPENYSNAIMEGMEQVVSWENRGTAGSAFAGFKYQSILAGKTGTAPISNIDLEDNIWFCLVAPKDDPEIAIVLFVPNGLSDCKLYDTSKAIITYYFDQKELETGVSYAEGDLIY